jgi:hypothetical protein
MVFGHREITARKLDQRALEQCSAELPYHERDLHAVLNSVSSGQSHECQRREPSKIVVYPQGVTKGLFTALGFV